MNKRLFIVANRLPVCIKRTDDASVIEQVSGGLVSAMKSYLRQSSDEYSEVFWAGVPGCDVDTWDAVAHQLENDSFTYIPVMINGEAYQKYYNGFSNSVLWPLFHYFPSYVDYDPENFDYYLSVNKHFAEVLAQQCCETDTVWIHDYHLLPLASMLRSYLPGISIGLFLHIPFPSFEILRLMPKQWQESILSGMMGADLLGFHTIDYAGHFLESVQKVYGLDHERNIIRFNDRLIKIDAFPISIDYSFFNTAYEDLAIVARRKELKEKLHTSKIIFSVDRLDYTKGVHNRLKAYELFLTENPEFKNKVVFVLNIIPSRDTIEKYIERKQMIDILISRINSQLGNLHWQPVIYRYASMEPEELLTLYTACNMALITPLRDGMNLVAKEFISSRKDQKGVLVLSELAGAARELTDALLINPNDIQEMARQIKRGLTMDDSEQQKRMRNMQFRVQNYDVQAWAQDFMMGLKQIRERQQSFQEIFLDDFAKRSLLDHYRNAQRRLLLLDYDGTLVPFTSSPEDAIPDLSLIQLLKNLGRKPDTDVYLISGRNSEWLNKNFGHLPINLIAEHGAKCKTITGNWETQIQTYNEWKSQVHNIMEMYIRRCPGSFIEEKEFAMVWHYRNCETTQGKLRALELSNELSDQINNTRLCVTQGNKIVEVRNRNIDKGTAINKIIGNTAYDFVFAVGDDRTDEDMFKQLVKKSQCYTIKVGPNASYAKFNLLKPEMVVSLLQSMSHLPLTLQLH